MVAAPCELVPESILFANWTRPEQPVVHVVQTFPNRHVPVVGPSYPFSSGLLLASWEFIVVERIRLSFRYSFRGESGVGFIGELCHVVQLVTERYEPFPASSVQLYQVIHVWWMLPLVTGVAYDGPWFFARRHFPVVILPSVIEIVVVRVEVSCVLAPCALHLCLFPSREVCPVH